MKLPLPRLGFLVAALVVAAAAPMNAGFKPGSRWPEVLTPYFHATTPLEGDARIRQWLTTPGCSVQGYRDSGSMHPVLQGGREKLALERYQPQTPLTVGQIVIFNRGDVRPVVHYIAEISHDGRQVYITGVNCRTSDGWFPRERISWIVREIITIPPHDAIAPTAHTVAQNR